MSELTVPAPARDVSTPGSGLDVVYVLSLLQAAFLVLAAVGEVVIMGGNPAYLLVPVVKSVLLIVCATQALRRRRWALRALFVLAWITLVGFALQLLIGLVPAVDVTVNLVGLMTNVGLPVAVILLCRPELRAIKQARRAARVLVVPQDPYLPVPATIPLGPSQPTFPTGMPGVPAVPIVYPPVMHGPPIHATPAERKQQAEPATPAERNQQVGHATPAERKQQAEPATTWVAPR